jgi:glycosyltransferase involved in cell wall biosynthesis
MQAHTFVIPAYKDSPYLESCLQSLLKQTVKSKLVLTTSTPSPFLEGLAEKYGTRYYINPEPSSIAGDWNFALSKATNGLVTIAHQDDVYQPTYVESILKGINKAKGENVLIAFSNYADLVEGKERGFSLNALVKNLLLFPFYFSKSLRRPFLKKSLLMLGDPICCPAVTLNLDALPGFSFSRAYTCVLDWHAWLQLARRQGSFVFVNEKLVMHRIHPESETSNQISNGRRQQEELAMFKQLWGARMAKLIIKLYAAGHKDNTIKL